MTDLLLMPEVSTSDEAAVLHSWAISEGERFESGDVIATVETAKAVVDVPAESAGVLLKKLVEENAEVDVGAPIAVVGGIDETPDVDATLQHAESARPTAVPITATPARIPQQSAADPGSDGYSTPGGAGSATAARREGGTGDGGLAARIFASPLARRTALEAGIPLEEIAGSGPHGRVRRRDVAKALENRTPPTGAPTSTQLPPRADSTSRISPRTPEQTETFVEVPHSRLRRTIADRLTTSKQTAPHFYVRGRARVDDLLALRHRLNEASPHKISLNDLVIKAAAQAHTLVPAMNVVWREDSVRSFRSVDISVAVATANGLVTPVLRSVERASVSAVSSGMRDYVERAKDGTIRQDELEGGSLTVTNMGMFGTEEFIAIINPPQAAVLAVGAVREEPVVQNGSLAVGQVMHLTLSVDHRPIDGSVAAAWMSAYISLLENPLQILA